MIPKSNLSILIIMMRYMLVTSITLSKKAEIVQSGPPNTQSLKLIDTPTADILKNPTSISEMN
jgi:hypothetical protein